MDIPAHRKRFVLLAALDCYGKALSKAKKATEDVSASTTSLDELAIIAEHLKAEYQEVQANLTLENTPLAGGDAATAEYYQDDDGTDLQTSALDSWLRRTAGAYVPAETISAWTLPARKLVAAWLRAVELNVGRAVKDAMGALDDAGGDGKEYGILHPDVEAAVRQREQQQARVTAPDFFDLSWFNAPTLLDDLEWTEADVDEWASGGPFGVQNVGAGNRDEWVTVKVDAEGLTVPDSESKVVYPTLDAARLVAAKANYQLSVAERTAALNDALASEHATDSTLEVRTGNGDVLATEAVPKVSAPLHPTEA